MRPGSATGHRRLGTPFSTWATVRHDPIARCGAFASVTATAIAAMAPRRARPQVSWRAPAGARTRAVADGVTFAMRQFEVVAPLGPPPGDSRAHALRTDAGVADLTRVTERRAEEGHFREDLGR